MNRLVLTQTTKIGDIPGIYWRDPASGPLTGHGGAGSVSWGKRELKPPRKPPRGPAASIVMGYGGISPHHISSRVIFMENKHEPERFMCVSPEQIILFFAVRLSSIFLKTGIPGEQYQTIPVFHFLFHHANP
jgi:hypothetical protein